MQGIGANLGKITGMTVYQNRSKRVLKVKLPCCGTDRTNPNNKPDIIIRGNKQGTCILIYVAIPRDSNVINKESEIILKCKDLIIEIQCMWNVKAKVIPVIRGANGTISKSLRQYLSNIPGKHEVKEIKKNAILGIAHIMRGHAVAQWLRHCSANRKFSGSIPDVVIGTFH
jgi:hypothetical protein